MPVKKKGKGPTYYTSEEDLVRSRASNARFQLAHAQKCRTLPLGPLAQTPFGFKLSDIIRTPLGVAGTVIGVK
jgi:hypothetical protein